MLLVGELQIEALWKLLDCINVILPLILYEERRLRMAICNWRLGEDESHKHVPLYKYHLKSHTPRSVPGKPNHLSLTDNATISSADLWPKGRQPL
jgi:hypothetical protein